jgi:hypothetical protein
MEQGWLRACVEHAGIEPVAVATDPQVKGDAPTVAG